MVFWTQTWGNSFFTSMAQTKTAIFGPKEP